MYMKYMLLFEFPVYLQGSSPLLIPDWGKTLGVFLFQITWPLSSVLKPDFIAVWCCWVSESLRGDTLVIFHFLPYSTSLFKGRIKMHDKNEPMSHMRRAGWEWRLRWRRWWSRRRMWGRTMIILLLMRLNLPRGRCNWLVASTSGLLWVQHIIHFICGAPTSARSPPPLCGRVWACSLGNCWAWASVCGRGSILGRVWRWRVNVSAGFRVQAADSYLARHLAAVRLARKVK